MKVRVESSRIVCHHVKNRLQESTMDFESGVEPRDWRTAIKVREETKRTYVGFMGLGKMNDRLNREVLWHLQRVYDVSGKLMNGVKSIDFNSFDCLE